MYLKVFVVVSKPVIPTGPLPDFYQKIDHTLVTSDILPLNDWIVYESIFWLSFGEYQTIDRQRMTAVARSLWKDWNFIILKTDWPILEHWYGFAVCYPY